MWLLGAEGVVGDRSSAMRDILHRYSVPKDFNLHLASGGEKFKFDDDELVMPAFALHENWVERMVDGFKSHSSQTLELEVAVDEQNTATERVALFTSHSELRTDVAEIDGFVQSILKYTKWVTDGPIVAISDLDEDGTDTSVTTCWSFVQKGDEEPNVLKHTVDGTLGVYMVENDIDATVSGIADLLLASTPVEVYALATKVYSEHETLMGQCEQFHTEAFNKITGSGKLTNESFTKIIGYVLNKAISMDDEDQYLWSPYYLNTLAKPLEKVLADVVMDDKLRLLKSDDLPNDLLEFALDEYPQIFYMLGAEPVVVVNHALSALYWDECDDVG